jgi:hypothetical protein
LEALLRQFLPAAAKFERLIRIQRRVPDSQEFSLSKLNWVQVAKLDNVLPLVENADLFTWFEAVPVPRNRGTELVFVGPRRGVLSAAMTAANEVRRARMSVFGNR